jgi:hypothetical protein
MTRAFASKHRDRSRNRSDPFPVWDLKRVDTVNWAIRHMPAGRSLAIKADGMLGYGKPDPERKWWLDVEVVDGVLRTAPPREK